VFADSVFRLPALYRNFVRTNSSCPDFKPEVVVYADSVLGIGLSQFQVEEVISLVDESSQRVLDQ
jgi:hypothetical protein